MCLFYVSTRARNEGHAATLLGLADALPVCASPAWGHSASPRARARERPRSLHGTVSADCLRWIADRESKPRSTGKSTALAHGPASARCHRCVSTSPARAVPTCCLRRTARASQHGPGVGKLVTGNLVPLPARGCTAGDLRMAELKRAVSWKHGGDPEKKTAASGEGNARELRRLASGLGKLHDKEDELQVRSAQDFSLEPWAWRVTRGTNLTRPSPLCRCAQDAIDAAREAGCALSRAPGREKRPPFAMLTVNLPRPPACH